MLVDNNDKVSDVADEFKKNGLPANSVVADISSPKATNRILSRTLSAFGRLDSLINNAGISPNIDGGTSRH